MLKPSSDRQKDRSVSIFVSNACFGKMLGALLRTWGCKLEPAESARLVIVEEGRSIPTGSSPVIMLPPLPLDLEKFWSFLQDHFQSNPRKHIRISHSLPASIDWRGRASETSLVSLSDMGARFGYSRELAKGECLELRLSVDGRELLLGARVIYVIPRGEVDGTGRVELGVVFEGVGEDDRKILRNHIFGRYLERVRDRLSPGDFAEGLSFLDLPQEILDRMAAAREAEGQPLAP